MSNKKISVPNSEASQRIFALRKLMDLSQEGFAEKLGVGRIAAVHWESGRTKPSAETYIAMAKVAKQFDSSSAVWFWEQVGVDRDALRDLLPEFNRLSMQAEQRVRDVTEHAVDDAVRVPLLRKVASIKAPTFASDDQIEAWLPLPALLVPNPTKTSCLWGPQGMTSLSFGGKDLLVIDSSDVPIEQLWGKMVIVERQSSGKSYVGFLQRFEMDNRLIPALSAARITSWVNAVAKNGDSTRAARKEKEREKEADSGELHKPGPFRPLTPTTDWNILGRAICRIGCERRGDLQRLAKGHSSSSGIELGA
jgi:transcriptional regulator with XRE-family HTH domain